MIVGNYEKFCKNFHLCEGYEKAINSSEDYFLHHIKGENISKAELIENNLYYDCEPEDLKWMTRSEHQKIHTEGKVTSEETRRKISESMKGRESPMKGKSHSEETRRKMSESNKGMESPMKGKSHSDETRRKMSEAKKGENNPSKRQDVRKKMSESRKGKKKPKRTPEHCKKLSESQKGVRKGMSWKLVNGKRIWYKKE